MRCLTCRAIGAVDFAENNYITRPFTNADFDVCLDYFDVRPGAKRHDREYLKITFLDLDQTAAYFDIHTDHTMLVPMLEFVNTHVDWEIRFGDLKGKLREAVRQTYNFRDGENANNIRIAAEMVALEDTRTWRLKARKVEFAEEFDRARRYIDHYFYERQQQILRQQNAVSASQAPLGDDDGGDVDSDVEMDETQTDEADEDAASTMEEDDITKRDVDAFEGTNFGDQSDDEARPGERSVTSPPTSSTTTAKKAKLRHTTGAGGEDSEDEYVPPSGGADKKMKAAPDRRRL